MNIQQYVGRTARSVLEKRVANSWFLRRAQDSADRSQRISLLKAFESIAQTVKCEHTAREMLVMADYILTKAPAGPLVECGCYQGGSSAKLSLVAARTGRKLYVCDSFQGLPGVSQKEASFRSISGAFNGFGQGQYSAQLEVVRSNIAAAGGDLSVCEFVEGFFCDSLPNLNIEPAFIFSDADLISSTRDVLRFLWPRLRPGGRFYTHDANLPELIEGVFDGEFWVKEIGFYPPVVFGAGYGCGLFAGGIAYCEKKSSGTV
ncbi:MAG: class I SAM-dependent methyltransferase [Acidobacteriaceae bacterium]|nr:class I SAM-dependent methyltransferase [Acidobacteriaceae bacterium]